MPPRDRHQSHRRWRARAARSSPESACRKGLSDARPSKTSPSAIDARRRRRGTGAVSLLSARDRRSPWWGSPAPARAPSRWPHWAPARLKRRCRPVASCSTALTCCSSIPEADGSCAAARIGLVFQDPFSVLNPSLRIGEQVGEGLVLPPRLLGGARLARAIELLARGRDREAGGGRDGLSARAVRRHAPARADRRRACGRARTVDPRRAHHRARRHHRGADPRSTGADLQAGAGSPCCSSATISGVVRRIADEVAVLYAGQVVEAGRNRATSSAAGASLYQGPPGGDPAARRPQEDALWRPFPAACRTCAPTGRLPFQERRCPFAVACERLPQGLREVGDRAVRCCRRDRTRSASVAVQDGHPVAAPRRTSRASRPCCGSGHSKTFTLTRGLAALSFEGWRPVIGRRAVRAVDEVTLRFRRAKCWASSASLVRARRRWAARSCA